VGDVQPERASSILERVRAIMSQISRIDLAELEEGVRFREELGVDSLMAMEIVATCEKELSVSIDEGQLYEVQTIGDFQRLVLACHREQHGR
jgi:acyl carrier protein